MTEPHGNVAVLEVAPMGKSIGSPEKRALQSKESWKTP